MAGRPGLDPIEEGKSYSALFVLMIAVLLVSAIWAIWDDNISRRPWKEYQVEFDRLAYNKYMKDVADEQKKLNDNSDYVKDEKELAEAKRKLDSGETQRKLDELESQEIKLKNIADDKDQAVRFTKSILTERMYDYNHAIQVKEDPAPIWSDIQKLQKELDGENADPGNLELAPHPVRLGDADIQREQHIDTADCLESFRQEEHSDVGLRC